MLKSVLLSTCFTSLLLSSSLSAGGPGDTNTTSTASTSSTSLAPKAPLPQEDSKNVKLLKQTLRTIVVEIYGQRENPKFSDYELDTHAKAMAEKYKDENIPELCKTPFTDEARMKLWYPLRDFAAAKRHTKRLYRLMSLDFHHFSNLLIFPPIIDWDGRGRKVDISYTNIVNLKEMPFNAEINRGRESITDKQVRERQFSLICIQGQLASLENLGNSNVGDITLINCPDLTSLVGIEGAPYLERVTLVDLPLDTLQPLLDLPELKFLSITRVDGYINDPSNVLSQLASKGVKVTTNTSLGYSTRNE